MDILLVEDNEGDIRLMREVLGKINPSARLHVATDGAEAIDFLRCHGRYLDVPRPDVILLDLSLPKLHGREVLARIKANPRLQAIPVIVLTTCESEPELVNCYKLMANSYLKKPENWNEFEEMVVCLNNFWFIRVKLPINKPKVEFSVH
jgi:two-component system, chemotaxis family, response regulator Rcp1